MGQTIMQNSGERKRGREESQEGKFAVTSVCSAL